MTKQLSTKPEGLDWLDMQTSDWYIKGSFSKAPEGLSKVHVHLGRGSSDSQNSK